jgi:hypothetical protein
MPSYRWAWNRAYSEFILIIVIVVMFSTVPWNVISRSVHFAAHPLGCWPCKVKSVLCLCMYIAVGFYMAGNISSKLHAMPTCVEMLLHIKLRPPLFRLISCARFFILFIAVQCLYSLT